MSKDLTGPITLDFFGRCNQAAIDRNQSVSITPAKGKHPIVFFVRHIDMIKHLGTKPGFLTAAAIKETVIDNENILAFFRSKILQVIVDDISSRQGCVKRSQFVFVEFRKR